MIRRVVCAAAFLIFSAFAAVQYNDPDALFWIVLYGYSAAMAAFLFFGRPVMIPSFSATIAYLAILAKLKPTFGANWIESEVAREGAGLIICVCWSVASAYLSFRLAPTVDIEAGS